MYSSCHLKITSLLLTILLLSLFVVACEPYKIITFVNKTSSPIEINVINAPLNYSGTPKYAWDVQDKIIEPGTSQNLVVSMYDDRSMGIKKKYPIIAITETNQVVFYKIFTWDELHDLNWKVEIKPSENTPENSDNTTITD